MKQNKFQNCPICYLKVLKHYYNVSRSFISHLFFGPDTSSCILYDGTLKQDWKKNDSDFQSAVSVHHHIECNMVRRKKLFCVENDWSTVYSHSMMWMNVWYVSQWIWATMFLFIDVDRAYRRYYFSIRCILRLRTAGWMTWMQMTVVKQITVAFKFYITTNIRVYGKMFLWYFREIKQVFLVL